MLIALVYGFSAGEFINDGRDLLSNPWGLVSLVDIYSGLLLFSAWVVFRDGVGLPTFLWIVALIVFGFFAASIYILFTAIRTKGEPGLFLMGTRYQTNT